MATSDIEKVLNKDFEASSAHGKSEYIKKLGAALKNGLLDGLPELQELVFVRSK
jgi:hypothetical protein